jgi:hypothetical protein
VTGRQPTNGTIGRCRPTRAPRGVIWATNAEWQAIVERARASGKPPVRFVRETVLRALGKARPNSAATLLLRDLGRAGTALAGLAATARETGALPAAATLETALAELVAVTRRLAVARRPSRPTP